MQSDKKLLFSLTQEYYKFWENKDIGKLESMFSDSIILVDPIINKVEGLFSVLEINKAFFGNCKTLRIIELKIYVDYFSNSSIGEVKFYIDDKLIEVVDIISFDEKMKIIKIVAYLDTK